MSAQPTALHGLVASVHTCHHMVCVHALMMLSLGPVRTPALATLAAVPTTRAGAAALCDGALSEGAERATTRWQRHQQGVISRTAAAAG
jgi:hypothetical protein